MLKTRHSSRPTVTESQRAAVINGTGIATYDRAKQATVSVTGLDKQSVWTHTLASMVAGLASATVSNPFDVVKTRYVAFNLRRDRPLRASSGQMPELLHTAFRTGT